MMLVAFLINLVVVAVGAVVLRDVIADFIRPWTPARRAYGCPHLECWSCSYETATELARHIHAQHDDAAAFALPCNGGPSRWEAA